MALLPRFSKTRSALFASAISALLLLSGCAQPDRLQTLTQINPIDIPAAQQRCPAIPAPPDPDDPNTTQRDIALYITELTDVAEHCKRDLITINRIVEEYNSLAARLNAEAEAAAK